MMTKQQIKTEADFVSLHKTANAADHLYMLDQITFHLLYINIYLT